MRHYCIQYINFVCSLHNSVNLWTMHACVVHTCTIDVQHHMHLSCGWFELHACTGADPGGSHGGQKTPPSGIILGKPK